MARQLDFDDLERFLEIDQNDLDTAVARHADLFYRTAKELAMAQSLRDATKQALAEAEAEADAAVRHELEVNDERITEGKVNSEVRLRQEVVAATKQLHEHNLKLGQWVALKEAYVARGYALKSLVDLASMNYFADPANTSSTRDKMATRNKEAIRQRLSNQSTSRGDRR